MRHRKTVRAIVCAAAFFFAGGPFAAAAAIVSGSFDDPADAALISSNGYDDLGPAQFDSDDAIARNVAVYRLVVSVAGTIHFDSSGYANGGAQPYFSIFSGADGTATFVDSSYDDSQIDFHPAETLGTGTYLFTIGLYENESFAENYGPPDAVLSHGFTGLGDPSLLGDASYQVDVTSDAAAFAVEPAGPLVPTTPTAVPEPSVAALMAIGLGALMTRRRLRGLAGSYPAASVRPTFTH